MPTLDDVDLTTTAVRLRGTAESFGKVEQIGAALKKDRCFGDVKPAHTDPVRGSSQKIQFSIEFAYVCSGEEPGGA